MTKHDITPLPPYPRLGECYRLLAKALDTKASNRHVDQLAREGDFDWQLLTQLREELIEAPLRAKSNENFTEFLMDSAGHFHQRYVALIKTVQLDALTRTQSIPALITHVFAPFAASFLLQMQKTTPSPPISALLNDQHNPVAVTFTWLEHELGIEANQLGQLLYPNAVGENKNGRELIQRWRHGPQLPALQSISLLQKTLLEVFPQRDRLITAFTEWLIIARALIVFDEAASAHLKLRDSVLREVLSNVPPDDIGAKLSALNVQASAHKSKLVERALILDDQLKRTTPKFPGDQARTRYGLDQFRHQMSIQEPEPVSTYFLEFLEGRWHVLAGRLETALHHYELAADLALYRSGEMQKNILREALLLAAYLRKLALYKRLKHRALVMGFSFLPAWDNAVATAQELEMIRLNFEDRFPKRGRFLESRTGLHENLALRMISRPQTGRGHGQQSPEVGGVAADDGFIS